MTISLAIRDCEKASEQMINTANNLISGINIPCLVYKAIFNSNLYYLLPALSNLL